MTAKANTNTATTFLAKTAVTITGGAVNDTITISDSLNASVGTIVGGTGDDTLNVSAKGSSFDLDAVTAVETINITFDAVDGFNFGAGGGSDATISAATVTYAGGKADQLYGVGSTGVLTDIGTRVIDASNLLGSIKNVFGDDGLSKPILLTLSPSLVVNPQRMLLTSLCLHLTLAPSRCLVLKPCCRQHHRHLNH